MFGAEMIPSGLFIILLFLIPESPRWLIKNNQVDRGFNILVRVSGVRIAENELREIKHTVITLRER